MFLMQHTSPHMTLLNSEKRT